MKTLSILIIFTASLLGNGLSDNDLDYKPGLLFRELDKLSGIDGFNLQEIHLSDSLSDVNRVNGKFFEVVCRGNRISTVYIGRVTCCRAGGCSNPLTTAIETDSEFFDYFIVFDLHGRIISVRVFNYAATHGQEITAKGWLNQFLGFDGNRNLRTGKEVDSISGATISVNGIVADIQEKTALIKTITKSD